MSVDDFPSRPPRDGRPVLLPEALLEEAPPRGEVDASRHAKTGYMEEAKTRFYEKIFWLPMALRIGLLGRSAPQNDGLDAPVILQCRTPQETNPKGHRGPNLFFIRSLCLLPPCTQAVYTQSYDVFGTVIVGLSVKNCVDTVQNQLPSPVLKPIR